MVRLMLLFHLFFVITIFTSHLLGECDLVNNFDYCNFDGKDCERQNRWPNCTYKHLIDNGECDKVNKIADCNFDGEDCKWSSCPHKDWINDGVCDSSINQLPE